jgi:hypothetical protein
MEFRVRYLYQFEPFMGGAPTYVLTDYVLGVRRELNEGTELFEWVFDPVWRIVDGLGLTWAQGGVPAFGGGWIEARWSVENGTLDMTVNVVDALGVKVNVIHPNAAA